MQLRFNHCIPVLGVIFILSYAQAATAVKNISNDSLNFHVTAQTLTPPQLQDMQSIFEVYTEPAEIEQPPPELVETEEAPNELLEAEETEAVAPELPEAEETEATPPELPEVEETEMALSDIIEAEVPPSNSIQVVEALAAPIDTGSEPAGSNAIPANEIINPNVNLGANAVWINQGESINLNWSTEAVTGCTASGQWQGPKAISGFATIGPVFKDSSYTLLCEGENGTAIAIVAVQIRTALLSWAYSEQNSADGPPVRLSFNRIYIGSQSGIYDNSIDIDANLSQVTLDLAPGQYYFAISSFDVNNNESSLSEEVNKLIQ